MIPPKQRTEEKKRKKKRTPINISTDKSGCPFLLPFLLPEFMQLMRLGQTMGIPEAFGH